MQDDGQATCGKGLAANAAVPAKVAELMATTAEVLERHMKALDPGEEPGRQELEAYAALVRGHREVAAQLEGLARQMEGYRDLPMASHDMAVMSDPQGQAEAYGRVVERQRELVGLLEERLKGS